MSVYNAYGKMSSFNGAEAKKPRKLIQRIQANMYKELLQWGRGKKASEIKPPFGQYGVMITASMGPRQKSLGNTAMNWESGCTESSLQWGRGKKASEIL